MDGKDSRSVVLTAIATHGFAARLYLLSILRLVGLSCFWVGFISHAQAAGGHHAVDDAFLLEAGQCQVEVWTDREKNHGRSLLHGGSACRVAQVELGVNIDQSRLAGAKATVTAGPQVKWAQPFTQTLSGGVVLSAVWQDTTPRFAGSSLVFPFTWQASEAVLVHVNLGRDFRRGGPDFNRAGVAAEWTALPAWSLVAERFREGGTNFWRGGARYAVTSNVNVDISRARGLGGSAPAWWTLGSTYVFDR